MDSTDQHRASLPPLKHLDFDAYNRDRDEKDYQIRTTHMTAASAAPSPSFQYPSGPPPPYSHPAPPVMESPITTSTTRARASPDIRRMSVDDQDKQQAKQSLPSIHEALGVEQPRYPMPAPGSAPASVPAPAPASYSTAPQSKYAAPAPSSPSTARRPFGMEPPPPPMSYAGSRRSPGPQYRSEISPRTAQEPFERARPVYAAPPPPILPQRNGYSPVHHHAPYPHAYPPQEPHQPIERSQPAITSMPPPPAPFSHGYASYQRPAYSTSYTAPSTGSIYQPSVTQPAPPHPEPGRPVAMDPGRTVYGESVKRHLDMHDFGEALNEIAETSNHMLEFSKQFGTRLHQSQRMGFVPGTLPDIQEIDNMMAKQKGTLDSLARMREVIIAQQAAYIQAQEQQFKTQDIKRDSVHQVDDSKMGGFAGGEAKKRRGRAAPPGRCHSCQRAETPEWRRGPDGARTLCNACGLHYAKLTRKQGAQKTAIGSSNLRPKTGSAELADTTT